MKIFYSIINNRLLEVNDIEFIDYTDFVEANNIDEFREKTKVNLDEDIEFKLDILFSENSNQEDDLNLQTYNIKHWVSNRSFGEIIDMYISGEILKPNMQREFVWDSLKCSRLIESIILGLPIPPLFLLEIDKNQYEIIDGFQRINTLVKYSEGLPWNVDLNKYKKDDDSIDIKKAQKENPRSAKLSKSVAKEIGNINFKNLNPDYQRILRRSTIPLIEFNQVSPDNFDSKYLIFERINTGSEKLNPMQIRKSLVYGPFMEDLYKKSDSNEAYKSLFSNASLKKDYHVEAYLRTYAMSKIYEGTYKTKKSGIKNILNEFCEKNKNYSIDDSFHLNFTIALNKVFEAFPEKSSVFKRVDLFNADKFEGNLNVSIMEAFIGMLIIKIQNDETIKSPEKLFNTYKKSMNELAYESLMESNNKINNPFTTSTGTIDAIIKRFEHLDSIVSEEA